MIRVYEKNELDRIPAGQLLTPAILAADAPSACIVEEREKAASACCSVWWEGTPRDAAGNMGAIGHFHAQDARSARSVLEAALDLIKKRGCFSVLAPMNGNTWRSYRYITSGQDRPPFLMEPPPALGRDRYLESAGFTPRSHYVSYTQPLTGKPAPALPSGFSIRILRMEYLEREMGDIYALSLRSFQDNPYYTDIPKGAFLQQYLAYRGQLRPELILIAYHGDEPAGFIFCIPDYLEGAAPRTVLLKTMAVLPEHRGCGLGGALIGLARQKAYNMGFKDAIGALIYKGNHSEKLCRAGNIFREYTLYGRTL